MNPIKITRMAAGITASLALCLFTMPAEAVIVPYLSGVVTQTLDEVTFRTDTDFRAVGQTASNNAGVFAGSFASASLANGTLRASDFMVQRQVGQFGAATLAGAFIGDNFIHSGPGAGPFVWNANQTVTFNLHIDGTQARLPTTPGIDRSQLVLMIYRPGTLDSDVPYCTPNVLNRYVWSIGANALPTDDCGSPTQGTINAGGNGNVNQNMQVTFAPGGDFAWALGIKLYTAAVGVLLTGPAYWNNDFSNTLTYSYAAPDGATVQSSSGYSIPRYTPPTSVPEPGTLALLGLGLAGLGIARRRRLADC